jgi:hypothetical protein
MSDKALAAQIAAAASKKALSLSDAKQFWAEALGNAKNALD